MKEAAHTPASNYSLTNPLLCLFFCVDRDSKLSQLWEWCPASTQSVECKCWRQSCEHIAYSVMWRFLGRSQDLLLFFSLPSSYKHVITHSPRLKTWQPNNTATWVLAGGAMTVQREKPVGSRGRKASCTAFISFWAACLPKGLDTVAQLAPADPTRLELCQSTLRRQAKKSHNNRQPSLSSLPGPFYKRSNAGARSQEALFCFRGWRGFWLQERYSY